MKLRIIEREVEILKTVEHPPTRARQIPPGPMKVPTMIPIWGVERYYIIMESIN